MKTFLIHRKFHACFKFHTQGQQGQILGVIKWYLTVVDRTEWRGFQNQHWQSPGAGHVPPKSDKKPNGYWGVPKRWWYRKKAKPLPVLMDNVKMLTIGTVLRCRISA